MSSFVLPDPFSTLTGAVEDRPEWTTQWPRPLISCWGQPVGTLGETRSEEGRRFPSGPAVFVQPSLVTSLPGFWALRTLRSGKCFPVTRAGVNFAFLCGFPIPCPHL